MGYFTWKDCQNRRRSVGYDKPVYVICPDNTVIKERSYFGYGSFHGHDIFELVVDWNRPYLKNLYEKKTRKNTIIIYSKSPLQQCRAMKKLKKW